MTALLNFPVVLVHGFLDVPDLTGTWKVVEKVLGDLGVKYFTPQIPPYGSIDERSASLIKQIANKYPGKTVHIFGQSMGGINARDLAAKAMQSKLGFHIKTVTTFGTPHRGVKWNLTPGMEGKIGVAGLIRQIFGTDWGALGNLGYSAMREFNLKTANNPGVRYFTWAGVTTLPVTPLCIAIFPLSRFFGPTDGLVNVHSAEWHSDLGPGTHLGSVHGMDHFAITGRTTILATIPHLAAAERGQTAIVQPVDNNLIQAIARRVEGDINIALGPTRAALGFFGLGF